MDGDSKSCLTNFLLLVLVIGLVLIMIWLFGDQIPGIRSAGGGSPLQGLLDSLAAFGDSISNLFKSFIP